MWNIADRLYLGNYWSGKQALAGASARLLPSDEETTFAGVVSLCPMPLDGEALIGPVHHSIEWLHLPISDGGMGDSEFAAALQLCIPFVTERRMLGNVLVHCAAGMSRSVSVLAAILCTEDPQLSVDEAFQRIAIAKAVATGAPLEDADLMISPAWEFHAHLRRRFPRTERRANGRS
ncbi:MAG: dual specificity protein phosphatase [Polyangiaceae bacterium]